MIFFCSPVIVKVRHSPVSAILYRIAAYCKAHLCTAALLHNAQQCCILHSTAVHYKALHSTAVYWQQRVIQKGLKLPTPEFDEGVSVPVDHFLHLSCPMCTDQSSRI